MGLFICMHASPFPQRCLVGWWGLPAMNKADARSFSSKNINLAKCGACAMLLPREWVKNLSDNFCLLSAVPPDWRLLWEETLLDGLLNFAATPKGLLLLQQTGAMDECVSYMFSRFTKKLQVCMSTHTHFAEWWGRLSQRGLFLWPNLT